MKKRSVAKKEKPIQLVEIYQKPYWKKWQFWVKIGLIAFILLAIFLFRWIIFGNFMEREAQTIFNLYFTLNNPESNFVFSIANGMMLGAYIAILYAGRFTVKGLKIFLFVIMLIFGIFGLSIGICFEIYLPAFPVSKFASNTEEGILFFIGNIAIFSLIFFASLFSESETDVVEVDVNVE